MCESLTTPPPPMHTHTHGLFCFPSFFPFLSWNLSYTWAAASCAKGSCSWWVYKEKALGEFSGQKLIKSHGRDTAHLYQRANTWRSEWGEMGNQDPGERSLLASAGLGSLAGAGGLFVPLQCFPEPVCARECAPVYLIIR